MLPHAHLWSTPAFLDMAIYSRVPIKHIRWYQQQKHQYILPYITMCELGDFCDAGKLTAVVVSTRERVEGWICRRVCTVVVIKAREGGVGDRNAR